MHINIPSLYRVFMTLSSVCILTGTAHAAESASFRFDSDSLNITQTTEGTSDSYIWRDSTVSWQPNPDAQLSGDGTPQEPSAPAASTAEKAPSNESNGRRPAQASPSLQQADQKSTRAERDGNLTASAIAPARAIPSDASVHNTIILAEEKAHTKAQGTIDAVQAPESTELSAHPSVSLHASLESLPVPPLHAKPPNVSLTAQLLDATLPASMTTGMAAVIVGLIGLGSFALVSLLHRRSVRHIKHVRTMRVSSKKRLHKRNSRIRIHAWRWSMTVLILLLFGSAVPSIVAAETSVPQRLHYGGRLYGAAGTPILTPHTMRFSFWTNEDFVSGDVTASGTIAGSAPTYVGWQEEQTVTPDSSGQVNVELGSITSLPDFASLTAESLLHLSLQVEVKAAGTPDTSYELLDPDNADANKDRFSLLSVPFALNTGMLDRRLVGTGSGAIPLLGSGGLLPLLNMGAGTNQTVFTVNAQNSAADAVLTFGNILLPETLKFSAANRRFEFSNSVHIENNLTASGTLTIQGNARFNSSVTLHSVPYTFPASDGTASGKVLKTNGAGQLSWSTDANTGTSYNAGQGLTLNGTVLSLAAAHSGSSITATTTLASSGTIAATNTISTRGNITLNGDNGATDATLTFGNNLLPETLRFSAANHRFEFSDNVHVDDNLTASGTLTVQGNARFKSSITLNSVAYTFPASDGTASGKVLKSSGAGQLSWSNDDNAPDTAVFSDTTTESLTDANVDLWDGTYPNISPSATTHTVLVNVVVSGTSDSGDDEYDAFTIRRAIGVNPTCTDTAIGGIFSSYTTNSGVPWSATATFLDTPSSTGNVRYTVCSDTLSDGTISNDTSGIWMSLIQLGN